MSVVLKIEPLEREHLIEHFECGQPALDLFLVRHALQAQLASASRTYVGVNGSTVVGYYTLVAGAVAHAEAPLRVTKGLARHPIPLMVLARLAVHRDWQKRNIGVALLRNAMDQTLEAANIMGIRALAVHAKDEAAASFYAHFGFVPSPLEPQQMFLLFKDIQRLRRM